LCRASKRFVIIHYPRYKVVTISSQELDDPGLETSEKLDLQQGLKQIRQHVAGLPPMTDCKVFPRQVNEISAHDVFSVTGQVERISDHPVTIGTFNDIYIGKPGVS